jgi:hypothetical protein
MSTIPVEKDFYLNLISKLLNPIPQYVLGCLPAITIVGASPREKFGEKLAWVFRCLGCPFTGLFYSCNVGSRKVDQCLYWLPSNYFYCRQSGELRYRPVGIHAMVLEPTEKLRITTDIKRCTARASILERFSSLVSAYYIFIGIIAGISRVTKPALCEDWPYIPLLLSWTIPPLYNRVIWGNLIVKDPAKEMKEESRPIILSEFDDEESKNHKRYAVAITALVSILLPWITVLLAYFTPPVGYLCRSKYITIMCGTWSLNNTLAYLCHLKGENGISNFCYGIFHIWFIICGFIIAVMIGFLGLLANNDGWWVSLFGPSCNVSSTCS